MFQSLSGVYIFNSGWSSLVRRFSRYFESGCLNHEKSKYAKGVNDLRSYTETFLKSFSHPGKVNPVRLWDTIWTVFALYVTMLMFAVVSHFMSMVYFYKEKFSVIHWITLKNNKVLAFLLVLCIS